MPRLQVSDLVQIVPAAARLEAMGGDAAKRIRSGIVELLVDTCDLAVLGGARFRLLQRVGEPPELIDAELRLIDEAIDLASRSPRAATAVVSGPIRVDVPPAVSA
jgi:hypothetical protein